MSKGLNVDTNIKDVGDNILDAMKLFGVTHVSLKRDVRVEGRSWEMCAAMALLDMNGTYSGVVTSYIKPKSFTFGEVPATNIKRRLTNKLITSIDLPSI